MSAGEELRGTSDLVQIILAHTAKLDSRLRVAGRVCLALGPKYRDLRDRCRRARYWNACLERQRELWILNLSSFSKLEKERNYGWTRELIKERKTLRKHIRDREQEVKHYESLLKRMEFDSVFNLSK